MVNVDDLSNRVKTSYHHPSRNDVDHKFNGCNSLDQHAMAEKMLLIDLTMKSFQTINPTAERLQIINPTVKRPHIINPMYQKEANNRFGNIEDVDDCSHIKIEASLPSYQGHILG